MKRQLIREMLGEDTAGIDYALPQEFVNHMRDEHGQDVRPWCVYDSNIGGAFGSIVNTAEAAAPYLYAIVLLYRQKAKGGTAPRHAFMAWLRQEAPGLSERLATKALNEVYGKELS